MRSDTPDSNLHGILKRKTLRPDLEVNPPINSPEPQGILKRRSGASSAGYTSNSSSPHVSIATAVILAAAGGAEMILDKHENAVKPILKKKSFSDEQPPWELINSDVPRPILKKKSSADSEDHEERTYKPILKNSSKSSLDERESIESSDSCGFEGSSGNDFRPILKQGSSRENSPRPRLSFCEVEDNCFSR